MDLRYKIEIYTRFGGTWESLENDLRESRNQGVRILEIIRSTTLTL